MAHSGTDGDFEHAEEAAEVLVVNDMLQKGLSTDDCLDRSSDSVLDQSSAPPQRKSVTFWVSRTGLFDHLEGAEDRSSEHKVDECSREDSQDNVDWQHYVESCRSTGLLSRQSSLLSTKSSAAFEDSVFESARVSYNSSNGVGFSASSKRNTWRLERSFSSKPDAVGSFSHFNNVKSHAEGRVHVQPQYQRIMSRDNVSSLQASDNDSAPASLSCGNLQSQRRSQKSIFSRKVMEGHKKSVSALAVLVVGDEVLIFSGSEDKDIIVWTLAGDYVATFTGHSAQISSLAVYTDKDLQRHWLISGSWDETIRIWALHMIFETDENSPAHDFGTEQCDGSHEHCLQYRAEEQTSCVRLVGHKNRVFSLALVEHCGDKPMIASGSADNTIKLWSLPEGHLIITLEVDDDVTWNVSLQSYLVPHQRSSDSETFHDREAVTEKAFEGPILVSGCRNKEVYVWSLASLKSHDRRMSMISIPSNFPRIKISHSHAVRCISVYSCHLTKCVYIATVCHVDPAVRIWTVHGILKRVLHGIKLPLNWIDCFEARNDFGAYLVGASSVGGIMIWAHSTGTLLKIFPGHGDSAAVLTTFSLPHTRKRDCSASAVVTDFTAHGKNPHRSSPSDLSVKFDTEVAAADVEVPSIDSFYIVSGGKDCTVRTWLNDNEDCLKVLHYGAPARITALDIFVANPHEVFIITGTDAGSISCWMLSGNCTEPVWITENILRRVHVLAIYKQPPRTTIDALHASVSYVPEFLHHPFVVCGGRHEPLKLVSLEDCTVNDVSFERGVRFQILAQLSHTAVTALLSNPGCLNDDGTVIHPFIVTGSEDSVVRVFSLVDLECKYAWQGHSFDVSCLELFIRSNDQFVGPPNPSTYNAVDIGAEKATISAGDSITISFTNEMEDTLVEHPSRGGTENSTNDMSASETNRPSTSRRKAVFSGIIRPRDGKCKEVNHDEVAKENTSVDDRISIISGSFDAFVRVWLLPNFSLLNLHEPTVVELSCNADVTALAIVPSTSDNSEDPLLIAGDTEGTFYVWRLSYSSQYPQLGVYRSYADDITRLSAVLMEGKYPILVSGHRNNSMTAWRLPDLEELAILEGHKDEVTEVRVFTVGSGTSAVASASLDGTVRVLFDFLVAVPDESVIIEKFLSDYRASKSIPFYSAGNVQSSDAEKKSQWPRISSMASKFGVDEFFSIHHYLFKYAVLLDRADFLETFLHESQSALAHGYIAQDNSKEIAKYEQRSVRGRFSRIARIKVEESTSKTESSSERPDRMGSIHSGYGSHSRRRRNSSMGNGYSRGRSSSSSSSNSPGTSSRMQDGHHIPHLFSSMMSVVRSANLSEDENFDLLCAYLSPSYTLLDVAINVENGLAVKKIMSCWRALLTKQPSSDHDVFYSVDLKKLNMSMQHLVKRFPEEYELLVCSIKPIKAPDALRKLPGKRYLYQERDSHSLALRRVPIDGQVKSAAEAEMRLIFRRILEMLKILLPVDNYVETDQYHMYIYPVPYFASANELQLFEKVCNKLDSVRIFNSDAGQRVLQYVWKVYGMKAHQSGLIIYVTFVAVSSIDLLTFGSWHHMWPAASAALLIAQLFFDSYYLIGEASQFMDDPYWYLHHVWNYVDLTVFCSNAFAAILRLNNWRETSISKVASSVSIIFTYFNVLQHLRAYETTGPLVAMIMKIAHDIQYLIAVIVLILIAFAQAFWLLSKDSGRNGGDSASDDELSFDKFDLSLLHSYGFVMGSFRPDVFLHAELGNFTTFLAAVYMLIVTVLLLNLLIALMGDSYASVHDKGRAQWRLERARVCIENRSSIYTQEFPGEGRDPAPTVLYHRIDSYLQHSENDKRREKEGEWRIATQSLQQQQQQQHDSYSALQRSIQADRNDMLSRHGALKQRLDALEERIDTNFKNIEHLILSMSAAFRNDRSEDHSLRT